MIDESEDSRRTILVVDDVFVVRRVLRRHIESIGPFRVLEAESGRKALELLAREPVDLAFVDIMMPGIDGIETVKRLNETEHGKEIPVIMCTAKADRKTVIAAKQAGAIDYIVKPFEKQTITRKIAKVIGLDDDGDDEWPPRREASDEADAED